MKKRLLSWLLLLAMLLSLLPAAAFAEGGTEAPPVCTCETACTAESRNTDCPVCGAEGARPEDCTRYTVEQVEGPEAASTPDLQLAGGEISVQAEHTHCICGGSVTAGNHTSHEDVTYTAWNGTDNIAYTNNIAYNSDKKLQLAAGAQAQKYTVTVTTENGGTAQTAPASAAAGETVALTATPNDGYHFKAWEVLSGNVVITDNGFAMPAENVSIKAIFEKHSFTAEMAEEEYLRSAATCTEKAIYYLGGFILLQKVPLTNLVSKENALSHNKVLLPNLLEKMRCPSCLLRLSFLSFLSQGYKRKFI